MDGEAFKDFEAAGWSANADEYDRLTGSITGRMTGALLDAAAARPGERVLDVGCGPGHLCAAAAERGLVATGVDLAAGMVQRAARSYPGIAFHQADVEDLPFADASFDAVVGAFVVNHLPRPERGAAELRRVLRPRGRLVLAMWDAPERVALFGLLEEAMRRARVDTAAAHRLLEQAEQRHALGRVPMASTSRPRGRRTRRSSAAPRSGRGRWLTTKAPTTASKLASANGRSSTSAWWKAIPG